MKFLWIFIRLLPKRVQFMHLKKLLIWTEKQASTTHLYRLALSCYSCLVKRCWTISGSEIKVCSATYQCHNSLSRIIVDHWQRQWCLWNVTISIHSIGGKATQLRSYRWVQWSERWLAGEWKVKGWGGCISALPSLALLTTQWAKEQDKEEKLWTLSLSRSTVCFTGFS